MTSLRLAEIELPQWWYYRMAPLNSDLATEDPMLWTWLYHDWVGKV